MSTKFGHERIYNRVSLLDFVFSLHVVGQFLAYSNLLHYVKYFLKWYISLLGNTAKLYKSTKSFGCTKQFCLLKVELPILVTINSHVFLSSKRHIFYRNENSQKFMDFLSFVPKRSAILEVCLLTIATEKVFGGIPISS